MRRLLDQACIQGMSCLWNSFHRIHGCLTCAKRTHNPKGYKQNKAWLLLLEGSEDFQITHIEPQNQWTLRYVKVHVLNP